jgi:uridine kinase
MPSYDREAAAERIRATNYPLAEVFVTQYLLQFPTEEQMIEVFTRAELREGSPIIARVVVAEIQRLLASGKRPLLAAFDGRSGSGKSSLAQVVADELNAALVPCDDFFAAQISNAGWDGRTAEERARDALDWRRLRAHALEPLLDGQEARWHAFDFGAGPHADGTYGMRQAYTRRAPSPVILLDGAYSTRPELSDIIDLSVLVEAPEVVRLERLSKREERDFLAAWHARWDDAEQYYFTEVRPQSSFDLIVATA